MKESVEDLAKVAAVAKALRMAKAGEGLTHPEISLRSGIPRRTAMRYFTGEREPTMGDLFRLARAMNTSVLELVTTADHLVSREAPTESI